MAEQAVVPETTGEALGAAVAVAVAVPVAVAVAVAVPVAVAVAVPVTVTVTGATLTTGDGVGDALAHSPHGWLCPFTTYVVTAGRMGLLHKFNVVSGCSPTGADVNPLQLTSNHLDTKHHETAVSSNLLPCRTP